MANKTGEISCSLSLLELMPPEQRSRIAPLVRKESFSKNHIIYYQEDDGCRFYEISSGQVKISKYTSEGKEITVEILRPGDRFGFVPLVDGGACECTATAISKTEIYSLGGREFNTIVRENPDVLEEILQETCTRLRNAYIHLETIASSSVLKRVSRIILEMARQEGDYDEEDVLVYKMRLTHQELANLAGTTRETVTRTLKQLKEEGYIRVKRSLITILKEDELEDVC